MTSIAAAGFFAAALRIVAAPVEKALSLRTVVLLATLAGAWPACQAALLAAGGDGALLSVLQKTRCSVELTQGAGQPCGGHASINRWFGHHTTTVLLDVRTFCFSSIMSGKEGNEVWWSVSTTFLGLRLADAKAVDTQHMNRHKVVVRHVRLLLCYCAIARLMHPVHSQASFRS